MRHIFPQITVKTRVERFDVYPTCDEVCIAVNDGVPIWEWNWSDPPPITFKTLRLPIRRYRKLYGKRGGWEIECAYYEQRDILFVKSFYRVEIEYE